MNQLNKTTQQNASAAEELSATSEEMSGQALELQRTLGFFKMAGNGAGQAAAPKASGRAKGLASPRADFRTSGFERGIDERGFAQF